MTLDEHTYHRTSTDGGDAETIDGRTMTPDGQTVATDGQTAMTTVGEATVVTGGDHVVTDRRMMAVTVAEEATMLVGVDPAVCSLSAFVLADETVQSESSAAPASSVPVTPLMPRRDFSARRKRVAGRKQAVVEDDGETQTSMSITSADEDGSMVASCSSRARNKGVRSRETEKDKDQRNEGTTEEGSNEERKRKRKERKREAGRKDTPEEEESDGKCGEPKGVVEHVFEDMSSSVLGGAILEWANTIDEIRVKSKNFQGRLSGEMKKCVTKIKEGAAFLVARSEATGDSHFLRMRNTELATQLRETEKENARLKE